MMSKALFEKLEFVARQVYPPHRIPLPVVGIQDHFPPEPELAWALYHWVPWTLGVLAKRFGTDGV